MRNPSTYKLCRVQCYLHCPAPTRSTVIQPLSTRVKVNKNCPFYFGGLTAGPSNARTSFLLLFLFGGLWICNSVC